MKESREIDILMAQKILGHTIFHEKNGAIRERMANGQSRPLRPYTRDISAAWEVVQKLGMTLIPVQDGWFALVGKERGWESPAEFLKFLQRADFADAGAAVGDVASMTICAAAVKALESRAHEPDTSVPFPVSAESDALLPH